ncbi:hypothetical protein OG936_40065 (plasmid) [Streptomyces sp. NBC_00846]|uniref:hypothetical protein n=1 Tax=Streptomyces sp. NBC_00846 TaxID=2975849 RepID=UPI002F90E99A|nr:hypothetical protein OG936_40065 [Streptomyces sp. NBC_00846]
MTAQSEHILAYLAPDDPGFGWEFLAEDFVNARLAEELTAAKARPTGPEQNQAVGRIVSLRLAVTQHATYVDRDGKNWARCFTCHGSNGFPCSTMRCFTRMWRHHPDYRPGWNGTLDCPTGSSDWTQDMLRIAARGGFHNDFLAGQAQGQTSPSKGDQVT